MSVTKEQQLQAKVSRLIWDIAQLSDALADDPQYDRHWKPRLERLLDYVSKQHNGEATKSVWVK